MAVNSVIRDLVRPAVESMGLVLWGVELLPQGKRALLRIYIDSESGVTVDDCANVSRQVSGILDVEDPISAEYVLEVSSPGMQRPLFELSQYDAYIGAELAVKLNVPFEGRRKFTGQLVGIEGDEVVLKVDDEEYLLPFDTIHKANLVFRD
ncbi:MAG: ribosome maturation factor RimP [Cellvibrionales bacterium]|nr:ribosome maturation factor RimP [Cellvibrionales bacterium]